MLGYARLCWAIARSSNGSTQRFGPARLVRPRGRHYYLTQCEICSFMGTSEESHTTNSSRDYCSVRAEFHAEMHQPTRRMGRGLQNGNISYRSRQAAKETCCGSCKPLNVQAGHASGSYRPFNLRLVMPAGPLGHSTCGRRHVGQAGGPKICQRTYRPNGRSNKLPKIHVGQMRFLINLPEGHVSQMGLPKNSQQDMPA